MKKIAYFVIVIAAIAFTSCSKTDNGNVEYIPFQETDDGQWGMISMDGKVLFSEEFKTKPTVVRDGRFFVRTKEAVWEMYNAEAKPQKIGADYAHVSGFRNGIALVAEKNKPVSIIDTDGKTKKVLDKIDGKEVDGVRAFQNGYAVFMTADSLWGAIDESGDCVVKPEYYSLNDYSDGKFIGVLAKYKKFVDKDKKDKVRISIIDKKGKQLFDMMGSKYNNMKYGYTDGLLPVSVKKDNKETWGLINDKGEMVVKPTTKIKDIGTIHGELFTYNNGDGWGLMNTKGETLIRAKYEFLYYDSDNVLVAVFKDGDSMQYKYIDEKDNQLGDDTYVKATLYSMFDGKHAIVKPNDKIYSIIDREGKQIEGLPDIVDVGTYEGEEYIESDFVDFSKLVKGLNISQNGMFNFNFNISPKDAVTMEVKEGWAPSDDKHKAGTPYWYDYRDNVSFWKTVEGITVYTGIGFNGNLSRQTYRTQRIIDYEFDDYYWYHDNHIPTGYVWNKVSASIFSISISNVGRMHGKLRELFKTMLLQFKGMGKIAKQNNGAAVFELKNGLRALVCMKKDQVNVFWGKLKPVKDIDISEYKDVVEEDDMSNISYGYLNGLFPDEVDTTAIDTVAVDTVAVD